VSETSPRQAVRVAIEHYARKGNEDQVNGLRAALRIIEANCTCYDDGVMCVTPPGCPAHGSQPTKGSP
jgi:hypothetical protein